MADIFSLLPINVLFPFLTFDYRFECEKQWLHTNEYNIHAYVYISERWECLSLRFSFFFYFYCFICGVISFSCWTDGLKYFYFYFRFRSSYFIDARLGHIFIRLRGIVTNWNLRSTSYEWERVRVFLFASLFLPLPCTMNGIHVVHCYNFSIFQAKNGCVCVPVCLTLVRLKFVMFIQRF